MKKILKTGLLLMMPLSLLFTACSSKEESDYVFGISNAYSLNQDDSYAVMSYVESRVDLDEAIIIKSASEQDANKLAIQEFNSRLTAINDAVLDTMFKGSDHYYSLILKESAAAGEEKPELARKTWPTSRQ